MDTIIQLRTYKLLFIYTFSVMNINSELNLKTNRPITHLTQSLLTPLISSEHLNLQMESYKFLNATAMSAPLTSP
jgi:hypothetical protein